MAQHTLIVLRHAKSDWAGRESDLHRPLAKRGQRQAPEAGRWLAANAGPIGLAIVSPATRARSTWELAAAELDVPSETREDERVYAASSRELLDVVRGIDERYGTAVLVGHNPGVEDLVEQLTGVWVSMVTSALAVVDLPWTWADAAPGSGTLRASGRPPS
jgi:phosphohistidine phosphatase